jgi:hypothetical protein
MSTRWMRPRLVSAGLLACIATTAAPAQGTVERPFGTLRDQAVEQQRWLEERMRTALPALMRKHKVDMWVVPMREYNEDPVFSSLVSPTTFAARRRTIYLFFDECAHPERPEVTRGVVPCKVQRIALGGTSQGGVFDAVRSTTPAAGPAGGRATPQAELWGDAQWQVLKQYVEARRPPPSPSTRRASSPSRMGSPPASSRECVPRSARSGPRASRAPKGCRSTSSRRECPARPPCSRR